MRAKTVRQRIEKKAYFRDQLLKYSAQTALHLSNGLCSHFYITYPFGLKLYTVKHNAPGKLKNNHLPKMPVDSVFEVKQNNNIYCEKFGPSDRLL